MKKLAERPKSAKSADATDVIVGRNIRIQRLVRGMSQTALAAQIGITFQQLQKYEKGANRVGSGRLARIAEVLDLPITSLFQGAATSRKRAPESSMLELIAAREPVRLVQAFAKIKDRGVRLAIVRLVENFAASRKE